MNLNKMAIMGVFAFSALASSMGANAATSASSAVVNITANVLASTCTPSWGADGVNVNLGSVSATDMPSKGDIGATKPFTLSLSDCDSSISKVNVSASGDAGADNSSFVNTGDAKGVAVKIEDKTGKQVLLPDSSNAITFNIVDGKAEMPFKAALENDGSNDGKVAVGSFASTVTLNMAYE